MIQKCACGALRLATIGRDGSNDSASWVPCAELAEVTGDGQFCRRADGCDADTPLVDWRAPMTWGEVEAEVPALPEPETVWRCAA